MSFSVALEKKQTIKAIATSDGTLTSGIAPNLHFPYLRRTQIYTNHRFTRDPNLHKSRFTRDSYLHNPDLHKSISAHRFQRTQIYTKPEFTQPNFAQNPSLHKAFSSNFAQTI